MNYVRKIKEKKELSGISDSVVQDSLKKVLEKIKPKSKKDEKIVIKEVRAELRKLVGRFKSSSKLLKLAEKGEFDKIVQNHKSTNERVSFYPDLKKEIFQNNPKSILDIGCGLNPIVLAKTGAKYYAQDVDENNLKILKIFFEKNKIDYKLILSDIRTLPQLPEADICLILKVFDIVKMPHKDVKTFLSSIKCKKLIASFPIITLSGRPMDKPRRFWFEKILKDINITYEMLHSQNEIFYCSKND
ncbi:hypothetical protein COU62_01395 [Candidatus Pacearchaeota archaeon CG10_big_fil_rev_8_21_14_0_10_35_219]|nr:hypothetical protein [Candidatus Pacearchaeota archaeon]OIO43378.1 MAG: hypothetical protein AUJ63_00620 [Candidatus Pacearchaeota archaeon CG1_02_35_32]PIO08022.1 MAG: hypothetical protein COU62_01395 [Candidatus Pacearchaeota archaeon CG10_big_fil_rev_8_21_14_0_10_35_219]PIY81534.1 MAG: hypothetical protein COY79_02235 [Candidatus Pacearchaeota archaeon CG_4_10_14_0_8_um_filter_35_169]PIZ78909.1 MAG: hypothetical protein COY00_04620 [Candidatus Pacearchaeota archaeon CG_4_10_14_0_2_um_filt